jgi:ABC-type antimicrobial peptide transport system permease subunit
LLFTAAVTLGAAALFAFAPALKSQDAGLANGLRDSSRSVAPSHRRMRTMMVTAEVALALPLLVGASLVVRTIGNPRGIETAVKDQLRQVDPDQGIAQVETMEKLVADSIAQSKAQTVLIAVFAALALSLAWSGIYGVLACSVAQRKREIGVRLALGASPARAFRLILREGLGLTATGMAIGVALSIALTRVLKDLLV